MLNCYTDEQSAAIPITFLTQIEYPEWLKLQPMATQQWLQHTRFVAEVNETRLIPDAQGKISQVICGVGAKALFWHGGHLAQVLPEGNYYLTTNDPGTLLNQAIVWGLGAYQFTRYKAALRAPARLFLPTEVAAEIKAQVAAIYQVRDLINTPTEDLGPSELAKVVAELAHEFNAEFTQIVGDELIKHKLNAIHTVGRASDDAPRLIELCWGDRAHPRVTLVGKGVCFDSGGLDIKPSSAMLLMKKDMGGAAQTIGLARMIMQANLPIQLRLLIPCIENVISGNAYRPGDVITMRSGLSVEVGNTDAEGRLILADALNLAIEDKPDLLIDLSTLTGAARVALGTDLPAMFSNNDALATHIAKISEAAEDYVWRMPLFPFYRELINSSIADLSNNSAEPYAGAITAALFLQAFVPDTIPWLHFDLMAWNLRPRPGRPQGGEAQAIRTLFTYLRNRYQD